MAGTVAAALLQKALVLDRLRYTIFKAPALRCLQNIKRVLLQDSAKHTWPYLHLPPASPLEGRLHCARCNFGILRWIVVAILVREITTGGGLLVLLFLWFEGALLATIQLSTTTTMQLASCNNVPIHRLSLL